MDTTLTHVSVSPGERESGAPRDPGKIPSYELLRFIKAGGFGDVWLARERVTGVRRAIKVLHKSDSERAARDIEGVRRYQRCAHNHPHLLQILTVGETDRCFYCVMDAADDERGPDARLPDGADSRISGYSPLTLRALAARRGPFDARAALQMIEKLVDAVARLHEQGLAHYDLKPENILIVEGEPKIADVGLVAPLRRSDTPADPANPQALAIGVTG